MVLLQLSQSQLTLLEQCPRKFQYIYLDQLTAPISPEQQEHLTRGSQVHHLLQQHELQLSPNGLYDRADSLTAQMPLDQQHLHDQQVQLYHIADALAAAVPTLDDSTVFRQSEYRLNLAWSGVLLTVIYDLLLLNPEKAYIFDWKTYLRPPNLEQLRQQLTQHWQTKLYPFVLAETSHYSPDDITLSYWFVKHRDDDKGLPSPLDPELPHHQPNDAFGGDRQLFESECLTFPYSDRLHQQTRQDLTRVIEQVQHWIDGYHVDHPFPKVDMSKGLCSQCPFQMRCDRLDNTMVQEHWEALEDIMAIPEIQPFPTQTQRPEVSDNSGR